MATTPQSALATFHCVRYRVIRIGCTASVIVGLRKPARNTSSSNKGATATAIISARVVDKSTCHFKSSSLSNPSKSGTTMTAVNTQYANSIAIMRGMMLDMLTYIKCRRVGRRQKTATRTSSARIPIAHSVKNGPRHVIGFLFVSAAGGIIIQSKNRLGVHNWTPVTVHMKKLKYRLSIWLWRPLLHIGTKRTGESHFFFRQSLYLLCNLGRHSVIEWTICKYIAITIVPNVRTAFL